MDGKNLNQNNGQPNQNPNPQINNGQPIVNPNPQINNGQPIVNPNPQPANQDSDDIYVSKSLRIFEKKEPAPRAQLGHYVSEHPRYAELQKATGNMGMLTGRPSTSKSVFGIWLIGREKDPLTLEQAMNMVPGNPKLEEEFNKFVDFVVSHPTKSTADAPIKENDAANNLKAWLDVVGKACDVIGDYRFPDIDYSNPKEVEKHIEEFNGLGSFVWDLGQEGEKVVNQIANFPNQLKGERKAISEKMKPLSTFQGFTNAFAIANTENRDDLQFETNIYRLAENRIQFGILAKKKYSGKTVKEAAVKNASELYEPFVGAYTQANPSNHGIEDPKQRMDMAKGFLRGEDNGFKEAVIRDYENTRKMTRIKMVNAEQFSNFNKYGNTLFREMRSHRATFEEGLSPEKTAEEISAFIKTDAGKAAVSAALKAYDDAFVKFDQDRFYEFAKKNPMDTIRIGGKTPQELWGQKYASLKKRDREIMFKVELAAAAVMGNEDITFEQYAVNERDEVVKIGEYIAVPGPATLEIRRQFLREIQGLGDEVRWAKNFLEKPSVPVDESLKPIHDQLKKLNGEILKDSSMNSMKSYVLFKREVEEYLDVAEAYYKGAEEKLREKKASAETLQKLQNEKENVIGQVKVRLTQAEKVGESMKLVPHELELPPEEDTTYTFSNIKNAIFNITELKYDRAFVVNDNQTIYDQKFSWLNRKIEKNSVLPQDGWNQVKSAAKFDILATEAGEYDKPIASVLQNRELKKALTDAGLPVKRSSSLESIFNIWLMGHKGFSVTEVAKFSSKFASSGTIRDKNGKEFNCKDLMNDFLDFAKKNPYDVKTETRDASKTRLKTWLEIYEKATQEIKDYTLPNIDLLDPDQIKAHGREFMLLRNIGVDGVQEWERFMKGDKNIRSTSMSSIGEEALGSRERFWGIHFFYQDMQSTLSGLLNGYLNGIYRNEPGSLSLAAYRRWKFDKEFSPYRGKKLGTYFEDHKLDNICSMKKSINTESNLSQSNTSGIEIDYNKGVAFLLNHKREEYNEFQTRFEGKTIQDTVNEEEPRSQRGYVTSFRYSYLATEDSLKFAGLKDDAASMEEFLNQEYKPGILWKDQVGAIFMDKLFENNFNQYYLAKGLNLSDGFMIDGVSVKDTFANKYNHIRDEVQKEQLYCAELLKAISRGEKTITARIFTAKNNQLVELEPVVCAYPRAKMQEFAQKYEKYEANRDELINQLEEIKKELLETQSDKEANFGNDAEEGSDFYQNMTIALQNAINALRNEKDNEDGATFEETNSKLRTMQEYADRYYEARKGRFFGPVTGDGQKRLKCSNKLKTGFTGRYMEMRESLKSDIIAGSSGIPFSELADADGVHRGYNNLKKDQQLKVLGKEAAEAETVKERIRTALEAIRGRVDEDAAKTAEEGLAQNYLIRYFEARIAPVKEGVTPTYAKISDLRMIEHFDERVAELAKNPVFVSLMKKNAEDCINRWHVIEANEIELRTSYQNDIAKKIQDYGSLSRAVAELNNVPENEEKTLAGVLRDVYADQQNQEFIEMTISSYYDKVAEIVLSQTLSGENETARQMRLEIANDKAMYDKYLSMASDYLLSKEALSSDNLSKLDNSINQRRFATNWTKKLKGDFNRERKNQARETEQAVDAKMQELSFMDDLDGTMTMDEFVTLERAIGVEYPRKILYKTLDAANIIMKPEKLTYTNEKGEKIEMNFTPDLYGGCNINTQRQTSVSNVFLMYLMGKHKFSFTEAMKIANTMPVENEQNQVINQADVDLADKYRTEFKIFVAQNQVVPNANDPEKGKKAYKAWARLLIDASEQLKNYKIPDINYRDPAQVEEHYEEIYMLSQACTDVDQEMDRLFGTNGTVDGLSCAYEEAGGSIQFNTCKNRWYAISGPLQAQKTAYSVKSRAEVNNYYVGQPRRRYGERFHEIAISREILIQTLQPLRGKTVEEAVKIVGQDNLYLKGFNSSFPSIGDEEENPIEGVNPKTSLEYIVGKNQADYVRKIRPAVDNSRKEYQHLAYETDQLGMLNKFWNNLDFQEKLEDNEANRANYAEEIEAKKNFATNRDWFAAYPEDAESMKKLFDGEIRQGVKTKDWVRESANSCFFNEDRYQLAKILGIETGELFLINGKNLKELYAEKYSDIADEETRNGLYRLELLKAIAKGDSVVELRTFKFENNVLVEAPRVIVAEKREDMKKAADSVHVYTAGLEPIENALKKFKLTLTANQINPEANFDGENIYHPLTTEGSEEYKDMTKRLRNLLREINDERIGKSLTRQEDLDKMIERLVESANQYERKNNGNYREGTRERIKLDVAKKIQEVVPELHKQLKALRANRTSLQGTHKLYTISKGPNKFGMEIADGFHRALGVEKKEDNFYKKKAYGIMLQSSVNSKLEQAFVGAKYPKENYERAREAVLGIYQKKINDGMVTLADLDAMERYKDRVEELAGNSFVQSWMKRNPQECIARLEEVEAKEQQLRDRFIGEMNTAQNGHTVLAEYVTGMAPNFVQPAPENEADENDLFNGIGEQGQQFNLRINEAASPEERRTMAQNIVLSSIRTKNEMQITGLYEKLADVVVWQGLINHEKYGKPVLQGIALNEEVYEQFKQKTLQYLKDNKVLENGKIKELFIKLDNGQFANEVMDKMSVIAAEEERVREAQLAAQREQERLAAEQQLQNPVVQQPNPVVQNQANPQLNPQIPQPVPEIQNLNQGNLQPNPVIQNPNQDNLQLNPVIQNPNQDNLQPNPQANINLGEILLDANEQDKIVIKIEEENNKPIIEEEPKPEIEDPNKNVEPKKEGPKVEKKGPKNVIKKEEPKNQKEDIFGKNNKQEDVFGNNKNNKDYAFPWDSEEFMKDAQQDYNRETFNYLLDAKKAMEFIKGMPEGVMDKKGNLYQDKINAVVKVHTALTIIMGDYVNPKTINPKSVEKKIFEKKENRYGLMDMIDHFSGREIMGFIKKGNIDTVMRDCFKKAPKNKVDNYSKKENENQKEVPKGGMGPKGKI